jgi:hypothetical protein
MINLQSNLIANIANAWVTGQVRAEDLMGTNVGTVRRSVIK